MSSSLAAAFLDVRRVTLAERRRAPGLVASCPRSNSQTIHAGDIETNYASEKAASVKKKADVLRNFCTTLPLGLSNRCVARMPKMVMGVGDEECNIVARRYKELKEMYPRMQLLGKAQIRESEPAVALDRKNQVRVDEVVAIAVENEHSCANYAAIAEAFLGCAEEQVATGRGRRIEVAVDTEVHSIQAENGMFRVETSNGTHRTRFVVSSASGGSLRLAKMMGFAKHYSVLPIAGSYYMAPRVLRGKVYTVQNPAIPFGCVHGDPDFVQGLATRFGPTVLPMPFLERDRWGTARELLAALELSSPLASLWARLFLVPDIRNYVLKNLAFEVPFVGKRLFEKEVQKVCPSIDAADLRLARGQGGVRPLVLDLRAQELLLGEVRIAPNGYNLIFNVTPSPGATTCLGNSLEDMRVICKALGANIHEDKLQRVCGDGEYQVQL
eukprot:Polyplicarium_translucidae@DN3314_c0_g1_i2.p1